MKETRYCQFSPYLVALAALQIAACVNSSSPVMDDAPQGGIREVGCGFGEPNNDRDHATPVKLNTAYVDNCLTGSSGTDPSDHFSFTAPNDAAGGYVVLALENVSSSGLLEYQVQSTVDNGLIAKGYRTSQGESAYGWFAVSPGAKYRVIVSEFSNTAPQLHYDLELQYSAVVDAFEPNNSKATAVPITRGTPITASAAAHSAKAELAPSDAEDWYTFNLAGSGATVTMSNVPSDYRCWLRALSSTGTIIASKYSVDKGANCELTVPPTTDTIYVQQTMFGASSPEQGGDGENPPDFVTKQYTLLVQ